MKQWYKTKLTKGILLVLAHLMAVMCVVSAVWVGNRVPDAQSLLPYKMEKKYVDSEAFANAVSRDVSHAITAETNRSELEKDGKYDPDKLVDIQAYHDNQKITGKNTSGLAYRLEDLYKWGQDGHETTYEGYGESDDEIVVCMDPDEKYTYYALPEFINKLKTKELAISAEKGSTISDYGRDEDAYRNFISDNEGSTIIGQDNKVTYSDFWLFDDMRVVEDYKPAGYNSVLDLANKDERWNGKIKEIFQMLDEVVQNVSGQVSDYKNNIDKYQEGDTNLQYLYANLDTDKVYTNVDAYRDVKKLDGSVAQLKKQDKYILVYPQLADFKTNIKNVTAGAWKNRVADFEQDTGNVPENYVLAVGIDTDFPIQDEFYTAQRTYDDYAAEAVEWVTIFFSGFGVMLICLCWLVAVAGRRPDDPEIHLNFLDKWKTELVAAALILIGVGCVAIMGDAFGTIHVSSGQYRNYVSVGFGAALFAGFVFFVIGLLSLTRRIKARTLWKNSLLKRIIELLQAAMKRLPLLWKSILIFLAFIIIHWIAVGTYGFMLFVMVVADVAAFLYILRVTLGRAAIKTGIDHIVAGDMDYKIPLKNLTGEQRGIAEKINNIGEGLERAVDKSMRSERMKTDLITNVSHDIKTPLTSIINYVGLLKQENFSDPQIRKYIEILEEKSMRLKKLTEDVVEASKVSSGNIQLERMNLNLVEMLQQASGEFAERLAERNLTEVLNLPEQETVVFVDSQKTWRILDNIYANAVKYALSGTRLYVDLSTDAQTVRFTMKNISEEPLNITPAELTERFIRGDESRTREGSGLGLSIAKSLTELQGGTFEIQLDGDLFKVIITFPAAQ